jgi:hypothetical protein
MSQDLSPTGIIIIIIITIMALHAHASSGDEKQVRWWPQFGDIALPHHNQSINQSELKLRIFWDVLPCS